MTTYVYGSPHGFNFYEGDAALDYYFKAFYISSRQGRRLMVNRRDDGTTIYSFLCYGLVESTKRPNAFFGMSVESDGAEYSPDFKDLYEWFDYLFGKLVERGGVFRVLDDGKLQYRIDKFKDAEEDIEWLKGNLPNIFTKSSGVVMLPYDRSYAWGNTGHVICCNIDTPPDRIAADFKRSQWVAVSPDFAPEEEREEINFSELEDRLNRYNQSLLTVAVNPSAASLSQLSAAEADCNDTLMMLRKYLKATIDDEELQQCREVYDKYSRLYDNIAALIGRMETDKRRQEIQQAALRSDNRAPFSPSDKRAVSQRDKRPGPQPDQTARTKTDGKSGAFFKRKSRRVEDDVPHRKLDPQPSDRRCRECHERKPLSEFNVYVDVCDDCASASKPRKESWWRRIHPLYASFVILVIVIIVSSILIFKACNSGDDRYCGYVEEVEVLEAVAQDTTTVYTTKVDASTAVVDPKKTEVTQAGEVESENFTVTVKCENKDGNVVSEQTVKHDVVIPLPIGSYVTISTSPSKKISTMQTGSRPTGGSFRAEVNQGPMVFKAGDKIKITVNGVKNQRQLSRNGVSSGEVGTQILLQTPKPGDTITLDKLKNE